MWKRRYAYLLVIFIAIVAIGAGPHNGTVTETKDFKIEVMATKDTLFLFLFNKRMKPLSLKGVEGSVKIEDGKEIPFKYIKQKKGKSPDYLEAKYDFSNTIGESVKVTISLKNLKGRHEKEVIYEEYVTPH